MTDLTVINPGSDLVLTGFLTDDAGAINLTGATLTTFEVPAALLPQVTLTVTNAAAGEFTCAIRWSDGFPRDVVMPLRLRVIQAGFSTTWPPIKIRVPK